MMDFRKFSEQSLEWREGLHLLWGPNGEGKTSVMEAIHVLATSRSCRSAKDAELARFGADQAAVAGVGAGAAGREELKVVLGPGVRRLERNGKRVGLLGYAGALEAVFFGSGSLEIARGGPGARRRFLDRAIAAGRPSYLRTLGRYGRALRAWREAALRGAKAQELESWEEMMAGYGAEIQRERAAYVEPLAAQIGVRYQALFAATESIAVRYRPSPAHAGLAPAARLQSAVAASRHAALLAPGPQRDDMDLLIGGHPLRAAGSAGQQRGVVLTLILWVAERTAELRGSAPILLIDDLEAELDPARAERLVEALGRMGQVFISSTRRELADRHPGMAVYALGDGKVRRAA